VNLNIEKPRKVRKAIILLIASILISFVSGIVKGITEPSKNNSTNLHDASKGLISALLLVLIFIGVTWFILYNVNSGRNWARIVCSFIAAFSAGYSTIYLPYYFSQSPIHAAVVAIENTLQIFAVVYLNDKSVIKWYENKSAKNNS